YVYYAAKAFLSTTFARWVAEEGLRIDVCSGGELDCALRAGFEPADLLMHGNNKSEEELVMALDAGVGYIVLDSFEEIARVAFLASDRGIKQRVLVRVTVGVEAHTHEFIATAHEDQKFGFSLATGDAAEAVARVLALPDLLELSGLHSHIGSQIFVESGFEIAAERVIRLLAEIRDEHGVELPLLNLGGGLGIKYVSEDEPPTVTAIAQALRGMVTRKCAAFDLSIPHLAFEPGRALVGPSAITVYTVGTVKPIALDSGGIRTYISVDGGMSDNIRTALYDADYTVTLASRESDAPLTLCRVVGKHCESGDIVVNDAWLPADITAGDLVAVAATGAYNRSMASNYNLVPRPPVIAVRAGQTSTLIRRETYDDLFATDAG
ncbi:MAG: diaminopimelate decarboxylase, partial [Actinomycetes bacterium]